MDTFGAREPRAGLARDHRARRRHVGQARLHGQGDGDRSQLSVTSASLALDGTSSSSLDADAARVQGARDARRRRSRRGGQCDRQCAAHALGTGHRARDADAAARASACKRRPQVPRRLLPARQRTSPAASAPTAPRTASCITGTCGTDGTTHACTGACDEGNTCPSGYACVDARRTASVCWPSKSDGGGCSTSGIGRFAGPDAARARRARDVRAPPAVIACARERALDARGCSNRARPGLVRQPRGRKRADGADAKLDRQIAAVLELPARSRAARARVDGARSGAQVRRRGALAVDRGSGSRWRRSSTRGSPAIPVRLYVPHDAGAALDRLVSTAAAA